jgi:phage gp29-like protein
MSKKDLSVEVISPTASFLGKFLSYMPNPDLLLDTTNETLEIYRLMMLDGRISSLLELRKMIVLNLPYRVKPIDESDKKAKEIADFVLDAISRINIFSQLKELLSALEMGFSFSEVVWELENGYWMPKELYSRKQERFGFKEDGTPVLVVDPVNPMRVLDNPYKFIVHRHSPIAENPYGNSVLKQCYWPWMFKKAGFRFWLTAAEKFGVPTVLALFDTDNEEQARDRADLIAAALSNIQNDAAVALSNMKDIKTLEMKGGSLADFKVLIDACNSEISYAISGQSLATSESKYGTRAQAEVHEDVLRELAKGDAKQLAWTLNNTLIKWIVELNFTQNAPHPVFEFEFEEAASWEIVKDAIDRGVAVSKDALYKQYNIPRPADEADAFMVSSGSIQLSDSLKKKTNLRASLFGA